MTLVVLQSLANQKWPFLADRVDYFTIIPNEWVYVGSMSRCVISESH